MIVEPKVAGERERERSMKECLLLLLVDSARLFITPWTPASVSYITAKPSLTDGHEWGEKNGCKIVRDVLGENKGGAVMDGCVWPMQGGRQRWVSSRWDRESAEPVPLCTEQPSLVRMRGISLSCLRQCFYHSCQNRDVLHIQQLKVDLTWWEYRSTARPFIEFVTGLMSARGQILPPNNITVASDSFGVILCPI